MKQGRLMTAGLLRLVAAAGLMVAALAAQAQNSIESLNVTQQGASVILKINLKDAPANPPAGFTVANPPRVALDFAGQSFQGLSQRNFRISKFQRHRAVGGADGDAGPPVDLRSLRVDEINVPAVSRSLEIFQHTGAE